MYLDKVLVTGGAGFIGSHFTDRLMNEGCRVTVIDNLSTGRIKNIKGWLGNPKFAFLEKDLRNRRELENISQNINVVFHFAANPEVRVGATDPAVHFEENLVATYNLLEAMRKSKLAKTIVFASTSTIYGEASIIPTHEDYGPLTPISVYGATKLGCEALITSYSYTFNLRALILRLANIVGPRSNHGVIHDFIKKLQKNPTRLEILGDGNQQKSYMHIDDCIDALLHTTKTFLKSNKTVDVYNVGSNDQISVKRIAEIIVEETGLQNVNLHFTGGVNGGRGWKGDVKNMHLSIEKLANTGWKPKHNSEQAIKLAVRSILNE